MSRKRYFHNALGFAFHFLVLVMFARNSFAEPYDPAASDYAGRTGAALYVSKLGDNSDGSSWKKAFHTIQAALLAVPDDKGGHRVIVRPDTYSEANLYPAFKGAAGSYNLLVGDVDGRLGSGASGRVVIDSGAPEVIVRTNPDAPTGNPTFMILDSGNPAEEWGLKSVDWWGPWKCAPDFSGVIWDRWIFRGLYVTGSEGGIGWDITCQKGAEFSALVEDCVGIGRFAGAAYVRGESAAMPDSPHATFENCTLVGPDNALQAGWPGVDDLYTRVKFKNCRLIVLNFSQPHGTPSTGVICCGCKDGRQLHVDFEDCTLMGFKVFGVRAGSVSYTTKGKVCAYVQYRQPVPQGMERLRFWPVDVFDDLIPPRFHPGGPPAHQNPLLHSAPVQTNQH